MHQPESTQDLQGGCWQGNQAVFIALGIANMYALPLGIDIADLQAQGFAETQAHAVEHEEEYFVAQGIAGGDDAAHFIGGDDIRQALGLGRLDQIYMLPRFL